MASASPTPFAWAAAPLGLAPDLDGVRVGVGGGLGRLRLLLALVALRLGPLLGGVQVGIGLLLGGVTVRIGLLAHGRVQLLFLDVGVPLLERGPLLGGGDFRLLLLDLEGLGLLGGGDALHGVGLRLGLVGDGLEFGSFQVELVLTDGHVLLGVDGRELGVALDLRGHLGSHVVDDMLAVGEVLDVERGQLQPKALHVDTRRFGDGGGERVAVLHELLELGLADDLAELAEQDLGDVLLHTLLGLVEVVAGRVLQRLGLTAVLIDDDGLRGDLEVGDGVHVDEDGVLRRDRRVRLEQGLHRTKRQPVDAHDERYDERGAAGDEPGGRRDR